MYSLHLAHPKWTHTRSSGQPCYSARGAVGGSVPCSRTPQSWYWRRILPPPTIPAGPEIRTHNLPLTSPTRYPLGHDCPTLSILDRILNIRCIQNLLQPIWWEDVFLWNIFVKTLVWIHKDTSAVETALLTEARPCWARGWPCIEAGRSYEFTALLSICLQ